MNRNIDYAYHLLMEERSLNDIFDLISKLRSKEGCPWDKEQTLGDIISSIISEAYELQWASSSKSEGDTIDELGDVFFLTCYAAFILSEKIPGVTLGAITDHAYRKIRRRHPHVFEGLKAKSRRESIIHWDNAKAEERLNSTKEKGSLAGIEPNLPPLHKAEKIQRAAAKTGFDWDDSGGIVEKLREELEEVKRCLERGSKEELKDEMGDLLFTVVNLCRFNEISCEDALSRANVKFHRRFSKMEDLIRKNGKRIDNLTLEQMDRYWENVKEEE